MEPKARSDARDARVGEREGGNGGGVERVANKARDLRERERDVGSGSMTEKKPTSVGALDCLENTVRKRMHVKQSINHTLFAQGILPRPRSRTRVSTGLIHLLPPCSFHTPY